MKVVDKFIESLRHAANYNTDVQDGPHCILWTDHERQWEVVIPRLREQMPELFILGDYDPEIRQGPAIWLRCVIADTLEDIQLPAGLIPVLYLPGVSRQDLRAVDNCPNQLKPLAELQYRGVIWSQVNSKDWTVLAFLQTHRGSGLNLNVAQDRETKTAMQLALPNLLDADISQFQGKRLDKDDFYQLISKDPDGELLRWLNEGDAYRQRKTDDEWRAFVELCRYHFAFNPETEGIISGAEKLAQHTGVWEALWERYKEVASKYLSIPQRIEQANPPSDTLDWVDASSNQYEGWPQWNALQEDKLRESLQQLVDQPLSRLQKAIKDLDKHHGHRRELLWAEMGFSPLAMALQHLHTIAENTLTTPLNGGNIDDLSHAYQASGWKIDDALIRALASVETTEDRQLISDILDGIYKPWAVTSARYLQQLVDNSNDRSGNINTVPNITYPDGVCVLFVDGLRFDVAMRLVVFLEIEHIDTSTKLKWSPLPSVTATGKPAASPLRSQFVGRNVSADFEPEIESSGKPANHRNHMNLLQSSGWQILERMDTGDVTGRAWTEIDAIDKAGHDGILPQRLDNIVKDIKDRIRQLLDAGWLKVEIVTDHGWLFLPNGLPKVALAQSLTDNQWGRVASLKNSVSTDDRLFPWFWNPNHYFALADGISCFRAGIKYAHGGLSLQECLTLQITATPSTTWSDNSNVKITDVQWRGLRCDVWIEAGTNEMILDIRTEPGNPDTSIVLTEKSLKTSGKTSVLISNEDLINQSATVVIIASSGQLMTQRQIIIGGDVE